MPEKHIPVRQCLGCGEKLPKSELIRILRTPEGQVRVDGTGKANGRGAYICGKESCLKRLRKSRRIEGVLEVSISDELWDEIIAACNSKNTL